MQDLLAKCIEAQGNNVSFCTGTLASEVYSMY